MKEYGICQLTTRDFAVLRRLVRDQQPAIARIQRELSGKLSSAAVLAPGEIPPHIVTLDSRVCFRCDGRPPETRVVSLSDEAHPLGAALSITTPIGLNLLGRCAGEKFTVRGFGGEETQAEVVAVIYQPEAAGRRLRCA